MYNLLVVSTPLEQPADKPRQIVQQIPIGSSVLKCSAVNQDLLFFGLASGEILMYDIISLEQVAQAAVSS